MTVFATVYAQEILGLTSSQIGFFYTAAAGYVRVWVMSAGIFVFSMMLCVLLFNNRARAKRREKNGVV
ncbi:MAG: hypothetical protein LUD71_04620 [Clostridiales bacterium]|nr:hypothetical protein [Clostridiales bacterium]